MEHRGTRLRRVVLAATTAVAAAALAVTVAPAATAAPVTTKAPTAKLADRTGHLTPTAESGVGTRTAGSGSRSGDFTTDLTHDILARNAGNGQLKVYPHSGAYSGTSTFQAGVTINYGWGAMRWIGQGDLTGDGRNDVVYIDAGGVLRLARHSGVWDGTNTLLGGEVIGTGWNINDMVFTDDWDADGFDDILARRAGTGVVYMYRNSGLGGLSSFQAAQAVMSGPTDDVTLTMGDFTNDATSDMLFVQSNGIMGVYNFVTAETWQIGYGWGIINAVTIADVNLDGVIDVLARRASDNALLAYTHTGTWAPNATNHTAYTTLNAPVVIGYNWHINNVIS